MATFTYEQTATLHALMDDHHAIEAMVVQYGPRQHIWLYDTDDHLVGMAVVNDLGDIQTFELMEAAA